MNLKNKVVVVTGGSSGLGEQICYEAAKKGAIVVVCARRILEIGKVKERCEALSQNKAYAFQLDIADNVSTDHCLTKIETELGHVDVLVNNAGFGIFGDFLTFDLLKAQQMFQVNTLGLMYFTQKIALMMSKKEQGHIINIASMAGKMATPKASVYAATKFAVIGFSNALRLELKPLHIEVTTVNPGPMATAFFAVADPEGTYLQSLDKIVIEPQRLAKKIVRNMERPRREINSPKIMELGAKAYTLFPNIGDFLTNTVFNKK